MVANAAIKPSLDIGFRSLFNKTKNWKRREAEMLLTPRQDEIVALAKANGRVLVDELAARFSVTPRRSAKTSTISAIHGC